MVSGTRAAHNVEITAESLQEDLARLEIQKQALERELAAVVAHLGSVQRALGALEVLMVGPTGAATPADPKAERPQAPAKSTQPQAEAPAAAPGAGPPRAESRAEPAAPPSRRRPEAAKRASRTPRAEEEQRNYGRLTEQILEYFAGVGEAEVRARDVAAALGRDTDSGSINAVRSTLDRLVGSSRVRRAGRGLYRAQQP
ncbi:hypothetical protein ABZY14_02300 [Streptomyces sp. NPDC006617]|uniref:hypothetical protein n=1 Tax=Streptomyces sp. NPDC006617 TaxID=3155354 RepID=UPI0033B9C730